jgi:VWFA-related protein
MPVSQSGVLRYLLGSLCVLGFFSYPHRNLSGANAAAAQSDQAFKLRVEVELVTTEVIVLDKKGNSVHNLKSENFRLYEDGKQQEISSFDEVVAGVVPSASLPGIRDEESHRGKSVLIIFDDSTITSAHIKASRDSAERFVSQHMREHDLFAVASFGMSLKILQNFTDDREEVLKAIRQPAISSADSSIRGPGFSADQEPDLQRTSRRQTPDQRNESLPGMRSQQSENLLRSLRFLSLAIERLKGQKSILVYSESMFGSYDMLQNLYKDTLNSAKRSNVVFYTVDPAGLGLSSTGEIRDRANKSVNQTAAIRKTGLQLSGIANLASRMNLYSMFQQQGGGGQGGGGTGGGTGGGAGGGTGGSGGSGGGAGTRGGSGGSGGSSGSTGGASTGTMSAPSNTGAGYNPNMNLPIPSMPTQSQQSLLRSLASESGGFAIYNTNDFDSELDKLDSQLSNYYILGFQSNNPKHDGGFRKLEVKTDLKGVTLRYRKGYLDRRPVDTLTSSRQEKTLLNALASPERAVLLPLTFCASYFYDSPRLARVLVSARFRPEKAEVKKKGGEMGSDVNIMGVAYAEDGAVSARFSETLHLAFDKGKETEFRNTSFLYSNYFKLRPGKYRLKMAVADEGNNLGSTEQILEIPPLPSNGFGTSSLIVPDRITRLPDLIQNLQNQLYDSTDPMIYAGMQISPSIEHRLPVAAPVPVFFRIYNLSGGSDKWNLVVNARLISENGQEIVLSSLPVDKNLSRAGTGEAIIGISLPFENQLPGRFKVIVEVHDSASGQSATAQEDVEFVQTQQTAPGVQ